MKTAEEWLDFVSIKVLMDDEMFAQLTIADIKQIQLDAMKEGMRKAAEVVDDKTDKQMLHLDCFKVSKAILTTTEQLTLNDL